MSTAGPSRWRRQSIPAQIKAQLSDRVLAAQRLRSGGWVVLTKAGIHAFADDRSPAFLDRPWHEVDQGEWDGEEYRIQLTWVDGTEPADLVLTSAEGAVADTLHERVQASLVHVEQEKAPGGGVLRGAIRRASSGELFSQVSVRGRVTRGPELEEQIVALENRVRSAVGMSP